MPYLNNEKVRTIAGIFSQPGISYKEAVSKLEESGMHTAIEIRNDPDKTEPDICIDIKDGNKNILNISIPISKSAEGLNWVSIVSEKLAKIMTKYNKSTTGNSKPVVQAKDNSPAAAGKNTGMTSSPALKTKATTKTDAGEKNLHSLVKEPALISPGSVSESPEAEPEKKTDAERVRLLDASIWDDDLWSEENAGIVAEEYEKDPVEEKETAQIEKPQDPRMVKEEILAQSEDVLVTVPERKEPIAGILPDTAEDPEDTKNIPQETNEELDDPGRSVLGISSQESDLLIGGIMASLGEMSDTEIENCAVESWNEEGAGYASMVMEQAKKEEEEKKAKKIQPGGKNEEEDRDSDIGAPSACGEVDLKKIASETDFSAFDDIL